MTGAVGASSTDIYEAVVALSRSIAGRSDLSSLLSGVADALRRIVQFSHVGMSLHDPNGDAMQGHILNAPGNPVIASLRLPIDQDPAGWVWLNQQTLVISPVQSETRWPEAVRVARDLGISTTVLVPLTAGITGLAHLALAPSSYSNPARPNWHSLNASLPNSPSPSSLSLPGRTRSESGIGCERCSTSRMRLCRSYRWMSCSLPFRHSSPT